jgi:hypothetical protein
VIDNHTVGEWVYQPSDLRYEGAAYGLETFPIDPGTVIAPFDSTRLTDQYMS